MSNMVEVKVSELSGAALDWAVAKADDRDMSLFIPVDGRVQVCGMWSSKCTFAPSIDWSQGGPLIEKYQVRFDHRRVDCGKVIASACGMMFDYGIPGCDSYLIAACRAIVSAKLGDTIQIPQELMP